MANKYGFIDDAANYVGSVPNKVISLFRSDNAPGDYSSRKAALARQQKLAEMLSQMGAQEQAVSTAGGITAPVSPMGALARGLTSFGGSYLAGKAAADEAALEKEQGEARAKALESFFEKPEKRGLVTSEAETTRPYQATFQAPTLPGVPAPQAVTAELQMPVSPATQAGMIPGGATSYADKMRMALQAAAGDDKKLAALAPTLLTAAQPEAERERMREQEINLPKPAGVSDAAWNAAGGIPGSRTELFNKSLEAAMTPQKRSAEYQQLVDAGYTPGTPEFNQQMQKFIRKDTYIAPVTGPSPGAPQSYIIDGKQVFTTPQDALSRAQRGSSVTVAPSASGAQTSEGERKAATLLGRLRFSQDQLKAATTESPDAASPPALGSIAGSINPVLGNLATPEARQRVEAAQLDILDAALTLGTGAAYTKEQLEGYRKSYFPQYGDKQKTKEDKQARLNNIIKQAEIAAGRALKLSPSAIVPRLPGETTADYIKRTGG